MNFWLLEIRIINKNEDNKKIKLNKIIINEGLNEIKSSKLSKLMQTS